MHPTTRKRIDALLDDLLDGDPKPGKPAAPEQLALGKPPRQKPEPATRAYGLAAMRDRYAPLWHTVDASIAACTPAERAILERRVGAKCPTAFPQTAARAAKVLDQLGVTPAVALARYYPAGGADTSLVPTLDERLAVLTDDERAAYYRAMAGGA